MLKIKPRPITGPPNTKTKLNAWLEKYNATGINTIFIKPSNCAIVLIGIRTKIFSPFYKKIKRLTLIVAQYNIISIECMFQPNPEPNTSDYGYLESQSS